jgi:hypothetical protein
LNWHTENTTVSSSAPEAALVRFNVQRAALDQLKTYQAIIVDLDDKDSIKQAKQAWSITRDLRLKIQKREKAINAELNKQKKELKGDAEAIINEIKETEDHLGRELEKVKRAEEERKAKIEQNMAILTRHCEAGLADGLNSVMIAACLDNLETTEIPKDVFQEKYQVACDLLNYAIDQTKNRLEVVRAKEQEAAEMARLKKELEEKEDVNRQVAWFNEVFGFAGTLDGMETGMVELEKMGRHPHLAELIDQQIEQGRVMLERARAAAPQPEPALTTPEPEPEQEPAEQAKTPEKAWGHPEPEPAEPAITSPSVIRYRPEKFPEIELFFGFLPEERENGHLLNPADVEFHSLEINGGPVSDNLHDHLFETFGDDWEAEIITNAKKMAA